MVHLFHLTCCFLVMRYERISLTALSTNAVEIGGRSRRRRPRIIDVMAPAVGECRRASVRALLVAHRGEIELIPSEGGALFAATLPLRHIFSSLS